MHENSIYRLNEKAQSVSKNTSLACVITRLLQQRDCLTNPNQRMDCFWQTHCFYTRWVLWAEHVESYKLILKFLDRQNNKSPRLPISCGKSSVSMIPWSSSTFIQTDRYTNMLLPQSHVYSCKRYDKDKRGGHPDCQMPVVSPHCDWYPDQAVVLYRLVMIY